LAAKYSYLLIALAVAAGIIIGFAATTIAFRHHLLRIRGEQPLERMTRELKLTPAQRIQLREIVEGTRAKIVDARRDCERQRRKLMADAYTQFRAVLKPPQQRLLDRDFVPPALRPQAQHAEADVASPPPAFSPSATATSSIAPTPLANL
jgi:Spy/CpxP family protein refolding chaperone